MTIALPINYPHGSIVDNGTTNINTGNDLRIHVSVKQFASLTQPNFPEEREGRD